MFLAISRDNGNGADADLVDRTECIANRHNVTRLHRLVHQQDETCDEVAESLLQAKPNSQAERTGEHRERCQVDPKNVDAKKQSDKNHSQAAQLLDQRPLRQVQRRKATDGVSHEVIGNTGRGEKHGGDNQKIDHSQQRDTPHSDMERGSVEAGGQWPHPSERARHGQGEGRDRQDDTGPQRHATDPQHGADGHRQCCAETGRQDHQCRTVEGQYCERKCKDQGASAETKQFGHMLARQRTTHAKTGLHPRHARRTAKPCRQLTCKGGNRHQGSGDCQLLASRGPANLGKP